MARGRSPTKKKAGSPKKSPRKEKSKSKSKSPSKHRHHDGSKERDKHSTPTDEEKNHSLHRDSNRDKSRSRSRSPHKSKKYQNYRETLSKKQLEALAKAIDEDDIEQELKEIKARYLKSKSHYFGQIVGNIIIPPSLHEDITKHGATVSNMRFNIREYIDSKSNETTKKDKKNPKKVLQGKAIRAVLWPTMSVDLCVILIVLSSIISVQHLCVFEQVCQYDNYNQYTRDIDPGIPTTVGLLILPVACFFCAILLPFSYYASGRSVHWKWNMSVAGLSTFLFLACLVGSILLLMRSEDKYRNELSESISSSWNYFPRSVKNYYVNVDAVVERKTSALIYIGLWALEYAVVAFLVGIVQYKKMQYKLSWGNLGK